MRRGGAPGARRPDSGQVSTVRNDQRTAGGRTMPPVDPALLRAMRSAPAWLLHGGPAVLAGRVLVLATVTIVVGTGPFLVWPPGVRAPLVVAIGAVMIALVVASRLVPWERLSRWALLAFPVAQLGFVAVLGVLAGRTQIAYAGLLVLSFVYAGLFLPRGAGPALILIAWGAYCTLVPVVDTVVVVRLVINGAAWAAIVSALAVMTAHQRVVAEHLDAMARVDALTGLANRRGLEARLAVLGEGDVVALCDLDHFKDVNDRDGHGAGDRMLARFAATIESVLGPGDYAARYGGEEFVVIFPRAALAEALATVEQLRATWRVAQTGVTFSTGVAVARDHDHPYEVLAAADTALYAAKAAGRDRIELADTCRPRPLLSSAASQAVGPVGDGPPAGPGLEPPPGASPEGSGRAVAVGGAGAPQDDA